MNIVLTGFMGTGKTAVGRRVAELLKIPMVDVDQELERQAGHSVAQVFALRGEAAFRALESGVIHELAQRDRTVISTGGGALLEPKNRDLLARNGILICLTARVGTLLDRLKDDVTRPLLAGENLPDRLERLMKEREAVYAQCPLQIQTDERTIAQVADEIVQKIAPRWQAA